MKWLVYLASSLSILIAPSTGQFPGIANAIWGPNSLARGVKNVVGGVLGMDVVHSNCMQKTLCSEFADEIVEAAAEVDPVKRTWVFKPKVVQRRGRLRWIGDLFANGVSRVTRKMGLDYSPNRRQSLGLVGSIIGFGLNNFHNIPVESMLHVMDFVVDATNTMERKGAVYPFVRASTLGYGFGHKRNDNIPDGVCSQIAEDCGGWWGHLETANNYDGGAMSRRVADVDESLQRDGGGGVDNQWNFMQPDDILQPRVFLCKAGRFLDNLNGQMGGDGVVKERFGNDDFQQSCDPHDLNRVADAPGASNDDYNEDEEQDEESVTDGAVISVGEDDNLVHPDEIEILEIRDEEQQKNQIQDLPILVFEGLPEPGVDQSDADLVESILETTVKLPRASVRAALRLPIKQTNGKSLVIVEMDTIEHELKVLKKKDIIRRVQNPSLKSVGIRAARYKELWKMVEELMVVKRVVTDEDKEDVEAVTVSQEVIEQDRDTKNTEDPK